MRQIITFSSLALIHASIIDLSLDSKTAKSILDESNKIKSRKPRANSGFFEEFVGVSDPNLERECFEDKCSFQELAEVYRFTGGLKSHPAKNYFKQQKRCEGDNEYLCSFEQTQELYNQYGSNVEPTPEDIQARTPEGGSNLVDMWIKLRYNCLYSMCTYKGSNTCTQVWNDRTCDCKSQRDMNPEDTNLLDVKVFTGDRCELDVDECADSSTHTCHNEHERCLNVEASRANPKGFACECEAGYRYSDDGSECVNINECAEGIHNCHGDNIHCHDTEGSFECRCEIGFDLQNIDGKPVCQDINECALNLDSCPDSTKCHNLSGSYSCNCKLGYEHSGESSFIQDNTFTIEVQACQDLDECETNSSVCGENAVCSNTEGSFSCFCAGGFEFEFADSTHCVDINECEVTENICGDASLNYKCINSEGSYKCQCKFGTQEVEGRCVDVNECEVDVNICGEHQECKNLVGFPTHHCFCQAGFTAVESISETFEGSGIDSEFDARSDALEGSAFNFSEYEIEDISCRDIDECADVNLNDCHLQIAGSVCVNTIGSYQCTCQEGFAAVNSTDGFSCEDINECELNLCGDHAICVNGNGNFTCQGCVEGYESVDGKCVDVNECLNNPCDEFEVCINLDGDFKCEEKEDDYDYDTDVDLDDDVHSGKGLNNNGETEESVVPPTKKGMYQPEIHSVCHGPHVDFFVDWYEIFGATFAVTPRNQQAASGAVFTDEKSRGVEVASESDDFSGQVNDMYGDYDKTDYVIYDQEQLQNNQNLAQYNSEQNSHRADSSEQVGQNTSEYVYVDQVQYDNGYTTDYQYAAPAQNPSLTDFIDEF